jgi:hypothetical protein
MGKSRKQQRDFDRKNRAQTIFCCVWNPGLSNNEDLYNYYLSKNISKEILQKFKKPITLNSYFIVQW